MNIINKLPCPKGWFSKTLPVAFDDSVSYLQMLSAILAKQGEIIEQLNLNTEFIENWDKNINDLIERVDALELEVNNLREEFNLELNAKIDALRYELLQAIAEGNAQIRGYVDAQVEILDQKIDDVALGQINVYDPTTGIISPLQVVINNLYDSGRVEAITASEFDGLELTATEFDAYDMTAYDFDTKAKTILIGV